MLLGSLLNVIGDSWLRVYRMNPEDWGNDAVPSSYIDSLPTNPELRRERWKQWLYQVVRHAVIGSSVDPFVIDAIQTQCLESPNLLSLIEELEARQRRWHATGRTSFDCKLNDPSNLSIAQISEHRDFLCLRIVGSARILIGNFGFEPDEMQKNNANG
jgi:hypothetical protein